MPNSKKRDAPYLSENSEMKKYIYADNAATTMLDEAALEAMLPFMRESFGNPSQPYFLGKKVKRAVEDARAAIADCINADKDEIYFTSGGTESDNWAIKCFGSKNDVRTVITDAIEHHAVLNACKDAFASVQVLNPDEKGLIRTRDLEPALKGLFADAVPSCATTLVSIMYANNEIGTIEPIDELCRTAHDHDAYFHTDAVQAVGHVPIDVKALDVDMLSASAHKFNGPKGIGFLFVKKGALLYPHNSGGKQERERRAGTENVAGIVGMATALKNNCDGLNSNIKHIRSLENQLIAGLNESGIEFVRNGSSNTLPGLISLSFPGMNGEAILHRLDLLGICVSTGSACNSITNEISHVLKAINLDTSLAEGTIRISLGKHNTEDDVNIIVRSLKSIIQ